MARSSEDRLGMDGVGDQLSSKTQTKVEDVFFEDYDLNESHGPPEEASSIIDDADDTQNYVPQGEHHQDDDSGEDAEEIVEEEVKVSKSPPKVTSRKHESIEPPPAKKPRRKLDPIDYFSLDRMPRKRRPFTENDLQGYRQEMEEHRPRFNRMIDAMLRGTRQNRMLFSKAKYDTMITQIKLAKEGVTKKTSADYYRLRHFDIIIDSNGGERLATSKNPDKDGKQRLFVHSEELFDLLRDVHARMGHRGREPMTDY